MKTKTEVVSARGVARLLKLAVEKVYTDKTADTKLAELEKLFADACVVLAIEEDGIFHRSNVSAADTNFLARIGNSLAEYNKSI